MLREQIELLYSRDLTSINRHEALQVFNELKFFLNNGEIRSAVPSENGWIVNEWVKKGILLGFRLGELTDVSLDDRFRFYDKSTYPLKKFSLDNQVRIVPGGSSVRDGSYVAKGVVIMPPSVHQHGSIYRRRNDDRFPCACRVVRADRQTYTPECRNTDRRRT